MIIKHTTMKFNGKIIPVRIVEIGTHENPATAKQIADVQEQLRRTGMGGLVKSPKTN